MKPTAVPCPKCNTLAECTDWIGKYRIDPDSPEALFGPYALGLFHPTEKVREIFECPIHGQFARLQDGSPYFQEPDTWVTGPNGERLFRT